eukprot:GHRQ01020058.1.p2 GENE.GHRQ01020058.1~~GHRQ01020058.1.p2  ORF type:complete len:111 (-),score=11.88 GHRQ01020058.1:1577-1909(-)
MHLCTEPGILAQHHFQRWQSNIDQKQRTVTRTNLACFSGHRLNRSAVHTRSDHFATRNSSPNVQTPSSPKSSCLYHGDVNPSNKRMSYMSYRQQRCCSSGGSLVWQLHAR